MKRKKFDSINVVPFIDIMLVLLVIVLTTASFIQTGVIKVDIPNSSEQTEDDPKEKLEIAVKKEGEIFFGKEEVPKENVEDMLLGYSKETAIHLFCDKEAQFEHFVFSLDMIKKNGYENLGIITKHE